MMPTAGAPVRSSGAPPALAVLAKGPVGLLLPLGIVIVVLAVERDLGALRRFAPLVGPLVFVLVTGAWAVAATLWGPADYSVIGALREHFVERGMHGMHHVRPFWYYAERLPLSLLPWTGLLPGASGRGVAEPAPLGGFAAGSGGGGLCRGLLLHLHREARSLRAAGVPGHRADDGGAGGACLGLAGRVRRCREP